MNTCNTSEPLVLCYFLDVTSSYIHLGIILCNIICFLKSVVHRSSHLSLPSTPSSAFACLLSASLCFLGHGATQCFGCFGKLHESWFDWWEVPRDLVHASFAGADSIWCWEGLQVLLRVWGPTSKPDTQLCRGKDGQGQSISLRQQLVLPHPSFYGAYPENSRRTGLSQRAAVPLPVQCLSVGVVCHVHGLTVDFREKNLLQIFKTFNLEFCVIWLPGASYLSIG